MTPYLEQEQKDEVSVKHPKYDGAARLRRKYQDVMAGTDAMRKGAEKYLAPFPAEDPTVYKKRLESSTLFNITEKTVDVMTGLVHEGDIQFNEDINDTLKELWENIDNCGSHGDVFSGRLFSNSFEGYSAILVDAPMTQVADLEQQNALQLRPYWVEYCADDIWNWSYRINEITKAKELDLIVLREVTMERVGVYISENVTRFRVYKLDEYNQVRWELWREVETPNKPPEYIAEHPDNNVLPQLSGIPVAVRGNLGDPPLLMELVNANIKYWGKQSNFDNMEFLAAVMIFFTKGYESSDGEQLVVGSDVWYDLPPDGEVGWSLIDSNGFASHRESLKELREEMSLIGLSMLADKKTRVEITATEALLNNIGETAALRNWARNHQDALENAMMFTAEFLRVESVVDITLGANWIKNKTKVDGDITELQVIAEQVDSGRLSLDTFLTLLGSYVTLPDNWDKEEEKARIQSESGLLLDRLKIDGLEGLN